VPDLDQVVAIAAGPSTALLCVPTHGMGWERTGRGSWGREPVGRYRPVRVAGCGRQWPWRRDSSTRWPYGGMGQYGCGEATGREWHGVWQTGPCWRRRRTRVGESASDLGGRRQALCAGRGRAAVDLGTPDAGPRLVEGASKPEPGFSVSWPGILQRNRMVRVVEGALEVQDKGETAARIESDGTGGRSRSRLGVAGLRGDGHGRGTFGEPKVTRSR